MNYKEAYEELIKRGKLIREYDLELRSVGGLFLKVFKLEDRIDRESTDRTKNLNGGDYDEWAQRYIIVIIDAGGSDEDDKYYFYYVERKMTSSEFGYDEYQGYYTEEARVDSPVLVEYRGDLYETGIYLTTVSAAAIKAEPLNIDILLDIFAEGGEI